ncbi:acyl-CoA dehydrogenase family protein, partial [Pseudomonas aeruginosa]
WLPRMVGGGVFAVIAMSESGIGSDLRSMSTRARRDGDDYIVSGQKTFITYGGNAGLMVTATKLDPAAKELKLICIEEERQGF